jgi:hypothetical protein
LQTALQVVPLLLHHLFSGAFAYLHCHHLHQQQQPHHQH